MRLNPKAHIVKDSKDGVVYEYCIVLLTLTEWNFLIHFFVSYRQNIKFLTFINALQGLGTKAFSS